MTPRDTREANRTASPLELLFDLTFVVAVAQIADQYAIGIGKGNGLTDIVPFLMVFFAIWWAWINFTWFASAYDTDDVEYRLLTLVQMAGVLVLAAGVPAAFTKQDFLGITIGYFIMRVGLVSQWIRAAIQNPNGRKTATRYAVAVGLIQLGWVGRLWLPSNQANQWWTVYVAFVVLVAFEVAAPVWAEMAGQTAWHPYHIAERYSLFTIILLGETIAALAIGIGVVLQSPHRLASIVIVGVSILVLIFGLWWLYFMEPTGEGLARHRGLSYYWGYAHYFIFAALAVLGSGIEVVTSSVGARPEVGPVAAAYAIAGPVSIYLIFLWAANAPIVKRIVLRLWILVPFVGVLLLVPLAVSAVGLAWDVAIIALLVVVLVVVSIAVKIRTHQAAWQQVRL
jgi:low temperature requirement protein LtrA